MINPAVALPCGRFGGTVTEVRTAAAGGVYALLRGDTAPVDGESFHVPRSCCRRAGIAPGWEGRQVTFEVTAPEPPAPGRRRTIAALDAADALLSADDPVTIAPPQSGLRVDNLDTLFGSGEFPPEPPLPHRPIAFLLFDRWNARRAQHGFRAEGRAGRAFRISAPLIGDDERLSAPSVDYRITRHVHLLGRDDGGEARDKSDFEQAANAVDGVLHHPRLSWLRGSGCRRLVRVVRENRSIAARGGSNTLALALGLGIAAGGARPSVQVMATGRLLNASGSNREPKILVQPIGNLREKITDVLASLGSDAPDAPAVLFYVPFQRPGHVPAADKPYGGFMAMPIQQYNEMRREWWDEFETELGGALRERLAACPNIILRPVVTLREALADFGVTTLAPTERLSIPAAALLVAALAGAGWGWAAHAAHQARLAQPIRIGAFSPPDGALGRAHAEGAVPVVRPLCVSRGHPALIQDEILYARTRLDGEAGGQFHTALIAVPEIHTAHDPLRIFPPICRHDDPTCASRYERCRQSPVEAGGDWCALLEFENPKANPDRPPGVGQLWRYFLVAQRDKPIDEADLRARLDAAFPRPVAGPLKQLEAMTAFVEQAFPGRQRSFDLEELTGPAKECAALPPAGKQ